MRFIPCLVLFFIVGCASSGKEEAPTALQDALAIQQKLMMSEGYMQGFMTSLADRFGDEPGYEAFSLCMVRDLEPRALDFFVTGLQVSLSEDVLRQGGRLARQPGLAEAKTMFKEKYTTIAALAAFHGENVSVYGYQSLAGRMEDDAHKENVDAFAQWLSVNADRYGYYFYENFPLLSWNARQSMDVCLPTLWG